MSAFFPVLGQYPPGVGGVFGKKNKILSHLGRFQTTSQFLNPVSINLKKLSKMPSSGFLNHSGRNWSNPGCIFYPRDCQFLCAGTLL
jgi:hypothetical protein